MNPPDPREEWMQQYADGAASAETTASLEAALRADAEFRTLFLEYLNLDGALSEAAALMTGQPVEKVTPFPHTRAWRRWAWAMAASVALAALIGALVFLPQASASPAVLLRQALKIHAAVPDRCYRVELKLEPALQEKKREHSPSETRLWTRGDRCWIETRAGEKSVTWGHDEQRRVWFALAPDTGVLFQPDEARERMAQARSVMSQFFTARGMKPPFDFAKCFDRLALACELCSLQVESLLHALLDDFDLRREPGAAGGTLIHAELKAGHTHPLYREVLLEVDAQSGVLRRLVVHRLHDGQPAATVTFTLVETSVQADSSYTLAGHLAPEAVIYDRQSGMGKRGPLLAEFLHLLWGESVTD